MFWQCHSKCILRTTFSRITWKSLLIKTNKVSQALLQNNRIRNSWSGDSGISFLSRLLDAFNAYYESHCIIQMHVRTAQGYVIMNPKMNLRVPWGPIKSVICPTSFRESWMLGSFLIADISLQSVFLCHCALLSTAHIIGVSWLIYLNFSCKQRQWLIIFMSLYIPCLAECLLNKSLLIK